MHLADVCEDWAVVFGSSEPRLAGGGRCAGAEPAVAVQHPADRLLGDQQGPQRQVALPLLHARRAVRPTAGASTRRHRPALQLDLHLHRLH